MCICYSGGTKFSFCPQDKLVHWPDAVTEGREAIGGTRVAGVRWLRREDKGTIGWPDTPAAHSKRTEGDTGTEDGSRAEHTQLPRDRERHGHIGDGRDKKTHKDLTITHVRGVGAGKDTKAGSLDETGKVGHIIRWASRTHFVGAWWAQTRGNGLNERRRKTLQLSRGLTL